MIVDAQLTPLRSVPVTNAPVTSPDTIDLVRARNIARDWHHFRVYAWVDTAFTAGGTSLTVEFIQSSNANLSSPDVLATSGAISTTGGVAAGTVLMDVKVPNVTKRYIGFRLLQSGTLVGGRVTGRLVETSDSRATYAAVTGR
jgi:hypothetical protein